MVKTTEQRDGNDLSLPRRRARKAVRNELADPLVRPRRIEVPEAVLAEHPVEMPLAEYQDVVETIPAHAAQKALAVRIHLGSSRSRTQHANVHGSRSTVEVQPESVVVVADEESRRGTTRGRVPKLLGDPCRVRISRHADVDDAARTEIDNEKCEDRPEPNVVELQKIARPDLASVVLEKGRPRLSRAIWPLLRRIYLWIVLLLT
jgi:hypothetical protein